MLLTDNLAVMCLSTLNSTKLSNRQCSGSTLPLMAPKVPTSETGTATLGMNVDRALRSGALPRRLRAPVRIPNDLASLLAEGENGLTDRIPG